MAWRQEFWYKHGCMTKAPRSRAVMLLYATVWTSACSSFAIEVPQQRGNHLLRFWFTHRELPPPLPDEVKRRHAGTVLRPTYRICVLAAGRPDQAVFVEPRPGFAPLDDAVRKILTSGNWEVLYSSPARPPARPLCWDEPLEIPVPGRSVITTTPGSVRSRQWLGEKPRTPPDLLALLVGRSLSASYTICLDRSTGYIRSVAQHGDGLPTLFDTVRNVLYSWTWVAEAPPELSEICFPETFELRVAPSSRDQELFPVPVLRHIPYGAGQVALLAPIIGPLFRRAETVAGDVENAGCLCSLSSKRPPARLQGEVPHLPEWLKLRLHQQTVLGTYIVCADAEGRVTQVVGVLPVSGADDRVRATMEDWRFTATGKGWCRRETLQWIVH